MDVIVIQSQSGKINLGIALLAFGTVVVIGISFLMWNLGFFRPMETGEIDLNETPVLFQPHLGAYHKVNTTISEVESWAKQHNISCDKTFGDYLDNPKKTEEARLRANVGCVLKADENLEQLKSITPEIFRIGFLPKGHYLQIQFSGSPAIGPMKVYPYAQGYFNDKHWPQFEHAIELYQVLSDREMRTQYLFQAPTAQ